MTDADAARGEGHALRQKGDFAGAADAFATAAEHYRHAGESAETVSGLVDALCDWAEMLTSLGDLQAAAARASEAVAVLQQGAMLGEGAVPSPSAARALLALGTVQLRGGDAAAMASIDAAVDMSRRLATALPTDPNRAFLARALNQKGMLALASGRLEVAAAAAAETVEIRRSLAAADPGHFTQSLGSSLNTLATVQLAQQDIEAAALSGLEACTVLRPLVEAGDMSALPNLAAAESNAAAIVGDLPDLDLAVQLGASAVEGYQWLVNANPAPAFVPELAKALVVLSTCLAGRDQFDAGADLCHAALAVLVENATTLSMPGLMLVPMTVTHYQTFTQLSGGDVDRDLLDAAHSAMAAAGTG